MPMNPAAPVRGNFLGSGVREESSAYRMGQLVAKFFVDVIKSSRAIR
jgi:hypothetical protein